MKVEQELVDSNFSFSKRDKEFVLSLFLIVGVGRQTIKKILLHLIKYELNFSDFWVNKLNIWEKCQLSNKSIDSIKNIYKDQLSYSLYDSIINKNIRVVFFWENEYPKLLKQCDDFPVVLFAKGDISILHNDFIGVVGTRRITDYGKFATKKIVEDLVAGGFSIASGFMYGVDLLAHLEAIENGGSTVAVLGFGFDHMYPKSHQKYFDKIINSGGCFITEYLPDVEPAVGNFPSRNRIVAGLSKGVVVVEAAKKSGSHITVQCAINEGREVFAVPGPINNPFSEGTKYLINQGATLITSGFDVIQQLNSEYTGPIEEKNYDNLAENQRQIVDKLKIEPLSIGSLADLTGIDVDKLFTEITLLEINGIVNVADNIISLKL
ncbi:DNA-processing protein DprA [Candidatus Woesebacteria bacterium]|nr:DNA-processing protein DprA [Candidatus Woesebacteria bacterium]